MRFIEGLKAISKGRVPEGAMVVKTTHGAKEVVLEGTNGRGFKIALDQIDPFIAGLEQECADPETMYRVGDGEKPVEIPGFKVPKVAQYLREARDLGVQLGEYTKIF